MDMTLRIHFVVDDVVTLYILFNKIIFENMFYRFKLSMRAFVFLFFLMTLSCFFILINGVVTFVHFIQSNYFGKYVCICLNQALEGVFGFVFLSDC